MFVSRSQYSNAPVQTNAVSSNTEIKLVAFDPAKLIPEGVKPVWMQVCDFGQHGTTVDVIFGDELQTTLKIGTSTVHADRASVLAWVKALALPKIAATPGDRYTEKYGQMQTSSIGRQYVVSGFGVRPVAGAVSVAFTGLEAF